MALTNSQYDAIQRILQERRLQDRYALEERRKTAYEKIPRLHELDSEVASLSLRKARILIFPEADDRDFDLNAALEERREERRVLLLANGFPENYLEESYHCPACRDTGYRDGEKCVCFRQEELRLLYSQSNIDALLETENFAHFSFSYYSEELIDPATGKSSLAEAETAYQRAREFVAGFSDTFENLCFFGSAGTGKTFLSLCIARELLEAGHSVLYLTATGLFDLLSRYEFSDRDADREALLETRRHIFESDLLIIDDLGSELTNSFVSSQLFLILNERILKQKSTVISTNYSAEELRDTYSDRIFSRLLSHYRLIKLFGTDIRSQKRQAGGTRYVSEH